MVSLVVSAGLAALGKMWGPRFSDWQALVGAVNRPLRLECVVIPRWTHDVVLMHAFTEKPNILFDVLQEPPYLVVGAGALDSSRAATGNPVRIRGCPAAVSDNDLHKSTLTGRLGSRGEREPGAMSG